MDIFKLLVGVLCLACLGVARGADAAETIFREDFEAGLGTIWSPVDFEGKTEHTLVREGTNSVLRARAVSSASGLGVKIASARAEGAIVSWKWKIDRIPPGGSDDKKSTFDHTGRIFVAFKTLIGPPRTINYVWGNTVPVQGTFHHPSSGRARFIVLQSGNARAGEWIAEERDLAQDWKTLFGNDKTPQIVGFGFMTDSDGTKSTVTGYYDDLMIKMGQ